MQEVTDVSEPRNLCSSTRVKFNNAKSVRASKQKLSSKSNNATREKLGNEIAHIFVALAWRPSGGTSGIFHQKENNLICGWNVDWVLIYVCGFVQRASLYFLGVRARCVD